MRKTDRSVEDYAVYNYYDKEEQAYWDRIELRKIQEEQEELRKYEEDYNG